jgi:hypothetical protein
MNVDLENHPQYFPWSMFERQPLRHLKERMLSMFTKSSIYVEELTVFEKRLLINGDKGFIKVKYYGV